MRVVPNTLAITPIQDMLLVKDAHPAVWVVALFIVIIITLLVVLISDKPHVLVPFIAFCVPLLVYAP